MENYLKKYFTEFFDFLSVKYSDSKSVSEMIYRYFYNIDKIPLCPICGNNNHFINISRGYTEHCCTKCTQKDVEVRSKYKESCKSNYGENFYDEFHKKGKITRKELYGDENYNNPKKLKQTCLERYGVTNPMMLQDIQQKSKKTCLEKYGSEYVFTSDNFISKKKEYINKTKQTCLERYGVSSVMMSEDIKSKVKSTCLERYGVLWNCMREEAHNSKNEKSTPNELFAILLKENNIEFEREFALGKFIYDFKINDILVEINPSATHNINFNPFSKTKCIEKDYHKNKTINAKNNGFRCVHVFDWDDFGKILDIIKNKTEIIYARKCEIKQINNKEVNLFLDKNHIQSRCKNQSICLGLFYNKKIVQVMTFGKPRYNKNFEYELLRLCSKNNCCVIGGAQRLFNYFVKNHSPKTIISYCDTSKFTGKVYYDLGFLKLKDNPPSCHWVNLKTKQHINNTLLLKIGFDKIFGTTFGKGISNEELMLKHDFVQVFDCGQDSYVWKKE